MNDAFKIYVKQLREGQVEQIEEQFSPDFLDVNEKDLAFRDHVNVTGEAYLANDELILHLSIKTHGVIPCSICNENIKVEIAIEEFYHAVPLDEIKSGIYNFSDILRETILLEVPAFVECEGNCPKRKEVQKYLKTKKSDDADEAQDEEGYHPFADLK